MPTEAPGTAEDDAEHERWLAGTRPALKRRRRKTPELTSKPRVQHLDQSRSDAIEEERRLLAAIAPESTLDRAEHLQSVLAVIHEPKPRMRPYPRWL